MSSFAPLSRSSTAATMADSGVRSSCEALARNRRSDASRLRSAVRSDTTIKLAPRASSARRAARWTRRHRPCAVSMSVACGAMLVAVCFEDRRRPGAVERPAGLEPTRRAARSRPGSRSRRHPWDRGRSRPPRGGSRRRPARRARVRRRRTRRPGAPASRRCSWRVRRSRPESGRSRGERSRRRRSSWPPSRASAPVVQTRLATPRLTTTASAMASSVPSTKRRRSASLARAANPVRGA